MITAAAMIPLLGLVGGATDIGRTYLVKSRMQQACDAGALAGRAILASTNSSPTAVTSAKSFFAQNFPTGKFGTSSLVYNYVVGTTNKITGTASVTVPTTIMALFGQNTMPIAVGCAADTQMPNVDIMFVLDTTGSMQSTNPGDTKTRINVLRDSVQSFYDSVSGSASAGAQVRYGFVPYSVNVNVGHLLKPEWLVDSWSYQSRRPNGYDNTQTPVPDEESWYNWTYVSGTETTTSSIISSEGGVCNAPASTGSQTEYADVKVSDTTDAAGVRTVIWSDKHKQTGTVYWTDNSSGSCVLYKSVRNNYVEKWNMKFVYYGPGTPMWWYDSISYDVTPFKTALSGVYLAGTGSISTNIGTRHTARTVSWNGCIEERQTVNSLSLNPIPSGAYDLNIDMVPTTDPATRWKPAIPNLIYMRWDFTNWNVPGFSSKWTHWNVGDYNSGSLAVCPTKARKLATMTKADLTTYLTSLATAGNTYHDIGMIWGSRLLSAEGLFATENQTSTNGGTIARHLILMTDGQTEAEVNTYGAYGFEGLDRRRTTTTGAPTNADINTAVEARLQAVCAAARGKFTVWVIAFGTTLSTNLSNCASPNSAFQANNATELNTAFQNIAGKIANLRLTQ